MNPTRSCIAAALFASLAASSPLHAQSTRVWTDPIADTMVRRTDFGNSLEPLVGAALPDIKSLTIGGWMPTNPLTAPFAGTFINGAGADVFRLDLVIQGLVNPPGPISASQGDHQPALFGPNPLYAYVELDADNDHNTGGESAFSDTYLGQAARFAARPQTLSDRAITSPTDYEADCETEPYFRRTGSEFVLDLCGCVAPVLVSQSGNMNGIMDAGETFVVRASFFLRSSGYQDASFMSGGFFPGVYDPQVNVQFQHSPSPDGGFTTVSLVFPLTMHGYALLNGLPSDPPANFNVADAVSVFEALRDVVIFTTNQSIPFCTIPIAAGWAGRNPADYLNVTTWNASVLVGTAYDQPTLNGNNVWTDLGFDALHKDVNGDSVIDAADRNAILQYIELTDGLSFDDEDNARNGSVLVRFFAFYYSVFDLNYDGFVNAFDLALIPSDCRADWDNVDGLNTADFFAFLADFFSEEADYNLDGVTNTDDFFAFLGDFFGGCP